MRSPAFLWFVRYGIPLLLVLIGIAILVIGGTEGTSMDGASLFGSAGLAVFLINVLFRLGVGGDKEREQEEEARRYFDRHGRWPDEVKR